MREALKSFDHSSEFKTGRQQLVAIISLALLYAAAGWLAHAFAPQTGFASIIWTPAGIALGFLLSRGWGVWPGVWLGACLINVYFLKTSMSSGEALLAGSLMGAGATLQALLGYALCASFYRELFNQTPSWRNFLRYFLAIMLASVVSASVGTWVLWQGQQISAFDVDSVFLAWWTGDSMGSVLIAPVVISFLGRPVERWRKRRSMVALPLLSAFLLLSAAFLIIGRFDSDQREAMFEQHAAVQKTKLQAALREAEAMTAVLGDLSLATGRLEASELAALMQRLELRQPALKMLVWVPAEAYKKTTDQPVTRAQKALASKHPVITSVPERVMPGDELAHHILQKGVLNTAVSTRQIAISDRVHVSWLDLSREKPPILMALPVYSNLQPGQNAPLQGIAVAMFEPDELFLSGGTPYVVNTIRWQLSSLDPQGKPTVMVAYGQSVNHKPMQLIETFRFGGKTFELQAGEGIHAVLPDQGFNVWMVYLGGLVFSILLCLFLLVMSAYAVQAEKVIEERSHDLEKANHDAEKAIKLLREAVNSIEQGFTIYDENDRLVICNEAYLSLYETSRDLIVPGASFEEIVRKGAERGQYAAAIGRVDEWVAERVAQHQKADGSVLEQNLGNGRWLMIVEYRTPSGFIAGNRIDISKIKQASLMIEDRNAQLDALFSLSPDGFVGFGRNGKVKFANPAFCRMTGISSELVLGNNLASLNELLRKQQDQKDALFSIAALDEEENGPVVRVLKLVHPENRMLQVISVRSDAESIGRILYVRDITHESEVNRMKSEFLAHAAHELRTPMTSILGFTELLLMRDFDPKMQKDILQTVHRQTQWLVDIINELLDLARIEARRGKDFKREEIDLHELINEVLQMQSFDQQRWPLELAFADEPIHVSVDAAKIKQALTNILGNALKYSPEGGVINIRVSTALEQAVIEIEDSGIGMNAEELRHFGERFWRADRSGKVPGTGLGMSIVKEIIELHGGCVTAQSSTGAGTIVTVQIPLIRQMAG